MSKQIIIFTLLFLFTGFLQAIETNQISKIMYVGIGKMRPMDIEESIRPLRDSDGKFDRTKTESILTNIYRLYEKVGYTVEIIPEEIRTRKDKRLKLTIIEGFPHEVRFITWATNGVILKKEQKNNRWSMHYHLTTVQNLSNEYQSYITKERNNGYYDMHLSNILLSTDRSHKKIKYVDAFILFEIGPRYKFGGYTGIVLNTFPKKILKELHKSGVVLNAGKMKEDLEKLRIHYVEKDYPFVRICTNMRRENNTLSVELSISNDIPYKYKGMTVKGLIKTKEYVISRENPFQPDENYSEKKRRLFEWRLQQMWFFKTNSVKPRQIGSDGFILDTEVEEQQTGLITLGATFSSGAGLGGYERFEEINFLGRGLHFLEQINFQQTSKYYLFGFQVQRMAGTLFSPVFIPYYSDQVNYLTHERNAKDGYKLENLGFILGSDFILNSYSRIGLLDRIEIKEKYNIGSNVSQVQPGPYFRNATQIYFSCNTIDSYLTPHSGYAFRTSLEFSSGVKHNDTYMKSLLFGEWCHGITEKSAFVLKGSYGTIAVPYLKSLETVADSDRFHLGSVDTIRGFSTMYTHPWPFSGLTRYFIKMEYRFYFIKRFTGLLFFDAGDQWDTAFKWYAIDLRRSSCSTGVELNFGIPMLPLRFILAYPLLENGSRMNSFNPTIPKFEFSVGWDFSTEGSGDPPFESMEYRF